MSDKLIVEALEALKDERKLVRVKLIIEAKNNFLISLGQAHIEMKKIIHEK